MTEEVPRPNSLQDTPLEKLPENLRVDRHVHEILVRTLEEGREPNGAQIALLLNCVHFCRRERIALFPAYAAAALLELRGLTTRTPADEKLWQKLEGQEAIRQLVSNMRKVREERRQADLQRLTASQDGRPLVPTLPDPTVCIARMRTALTQGNYDHAVETGSQAATVHSRFPEILFTAGMCYARRAAAAQEATTFLRVQDLKQAERLLGECLTLANDPQHPYFAKWKELAAGPLAQVQAAHFTLEQRVQQEEEEFRRAEAKRLAAERRASHPKRGGKQPTPPNA